MGEGQNEDSRWIGKAESLKGNSEPYVQDYSLPLWVPQAHRCAVYKFMHQGLASKPRTEQTLPSVKDSCKSSSECCGSEAAVLEVEARGLRSLKLQCRTQTLRKQFLFFTMQIKALRHSTVGMWLHEGDTASRTTTRSASRAADCQFPAISPAPHLCWPWNIYRRDRCTDACAVCFNTAISNWLLPNSCPIYTGLDQSPPGLHLDCIFIYLDILKQLNLELPVH